VPAEAEATATLRKGPKRKIAQPVEAPSRSARRTRRQRSPKPAVARRSLWSWLPLALLGAVLVAVLVVDLTWLGGLDHPSGHRASTSTEDRQQLLSQAKSKVAKVASYDYRHIDQDAKDAEAGTTGDFTATYAKSIETVIKPLAAQVKAIVACSVQTAAISSVSGDGKQAVVLIYAQLSTQNSTTNGQSRLDIATIQATMNKRGGDWYISKLDRE
jgi:hypothetical protein